MSEIISTKREYYIQAQLYTTGQWVRILPYDNVTYEEARQKAEGEELSSLRGVRIVEVETTERVVPVEI